MKTPTRILIINTHSAENAGDRALLECTVHQLTTAFPSTEIVISANRPNEQYFQSCGYKVIPSFTFLAGQSQKKSAIYQILNATTGWRQTHRISKANLDPWQVLAKEFQAADLVVGVAGNQFHSSGKFSWPMVLLSAEVQLAHDYHKPFYTMPQSIGPFRASWECQLVKHLYRNGRIIFLRDPISVSLANEIGLESVVSFAPDPAFAFQPGDSSEAFQILSQYGFLPGQPAIGITVLPGLGGSVNQRDIQNYYTSLAAGLDAFLQNQDVHLYFFNQVSGSSNIEDDRVGIQKILSLLEKHQDRLHWINSSLSPAQLKACYGWMELFIPSRLHSGIFALGMGVPCMFIGYLTKTRGVLKSLGLERWVAQLEALTPELVHSKIVAAWEERQINKVLLQKILPPVIEAAQMPGKIIAKDFQSLL